MITFFETIKNTVTDIQLTGGDIREHITPPPDLIQRVREYAVQEMSHDVKRFGYLLFEWFTQGFFYELVRVCIVHLNKLGITEQEQIYRILTKVIHAVLAEYYYNMGEETDDFEEQLAWMLHEIWDQMGDEQTLAYTFAQKRWLITWNYQASQWKTTSLGEFFLELSPIQGTIFVLSIDTLISTGTQDFHHIHSQILQNILEGKTERVLPFSSHRQVLFRLGIITSERSCTNVEVTPIGKIILSRIVKHDNPFRDAASTMIKAEELGDVLKKTSSEIEDILEYVKKSQFIDHENNESINTSVILYQQGKYLEALRIIFPSIEAVINKMLVSAGQQPTQFNGLVRKAEWLEQHNIIPFDVSSAMEVFSGRNKVVHGNFSPPSDYVFPLCLLAFRYLRRLLTEYSPLKDSSVT